MKREKCPCCGYPTLVIRGFNEICRLCDWEDDGQDNPHADEVWGGPNGNYSLKEARDNFEAHCIMYREKRLINSKWNNTNKKNDLMNAYESLEEGNEERNSATWKKIIDLEKEDDTERENQTY